MFTYHAELKTATVIWKNNGEMHVPARFKILTKKCYDPLNISHMEMKYQAIIEHIKLIGHSIQVDLRFFCQSYFYIIFKTYMLKDTRH